jgi:hypothetical protein
MTAAGGNGAPALRALGACEGDPSPALFRARTSFQSALHEACAARLPPGSSGGAVQISMRVGSNGAVSEACIQRDFIGDEALRQCLREQARAFRFPPLRAGDFLNLGLDVTFRHLGIPSRALCTP